MNLAEDRLAILIGKQNHNYTYKIQNLHVYEIYSQEVRDDNSTHDHALLFNRELPEQFQDLSINFEFC